MVAVNPVSGELAYAAGCIVVVYNLRRNKQVRYYRVDKGVACLSFSPNGQFLAIGEKGYLPAITIWDGTDGTLCAELQCHQYGVACLAFSHDGRFLLSAGLVHDQHLYAWELKLKRKDAGRRLTVTPVGCALVEDKILDADYCQAGNFFVTVGEKHFKYWFLDDNGSFLVTGHHVNELPELQHRDAVVNAKTSATFTSVGCGYGSCELKTFAVTSDGTLCCFGASGIMERLVSLESTCGNAISVTESYVAVGGSSGVVRLFNPSTLEYRATLPFPPAFGSANELPKSAPTTTNTLYPTDPFRYPAVIATRITGSHVIVFYSDRSIFIYGTANPDAVATERSFLYHSGGIRDLQVAGFVRGINEKGKLVYSNSDSSGGVSADSVPTGTFITCSDDNTIRLWNLELHRRPAKSNRFEPNDAAGQSDHELWKSPYSQEMLHVIYNDHEHDFRDEHSVVLGGTCSHEANNNVHSPPKDYGRNKGLRAVAIRPDQKEVAAGDHEGNVVVVPLPLGKPLVKIGAHSSKVNCLSYSSQRPDGTILMASGGKDGLIQLYDCQKGHTVLSTLESHSASVATVALSRDGNTVLSCGADNAVSLSGIDSKGEAINSRLLPLSGGKVFGVEILCDSDSVVATCNNQLEIFSVSSENQRILHTVGEQHHIAVCPANYCVAMSGSLAERTIHVVDMITGETLATGTGHGDVITALRFTPDCRRLLSASNDGCIFVWRLADDIQTEIKARLPRVMEEQWPSPIPPLVKNVEDSSSILPPPAPPVPGSVKKMQAANLRVSAASAMPTTITSEKQPNGSIATDMNNELQNPELQTSIPKWKGKGVAVPGPMADIPLQEWMRTRTTAKPTVHVVDDTSDQDTKSHAPAPRAVSVSPLKDKFFNLSIQTVDVNTKSATSLALEREQLEKRKRQMDTVNAVAAMNTRLSQLGLLKPPPKATPTSLSRLKSPSPLKKQKSTDSRQIIDVEISSVSTMSKPLAFTSAQVCQTSPSKQEIDISNSVQASETTVSNEDAGTTAPPQDSKPITSSGEYARKKSDDLVSQALRTLNSDEPPRPAPVEAEVGASLSMHINGYDSKKHGNRDEDAEDQLVQNQIEVDASLSSFTSGFQASASDANNAAQRSVVVSESVVSSLSAFTAGYGPDVNVAHADAASHNAKNGLIADPQQIPVNISLSNFVSGFGTMKDDNAIDTKEAVRSPSVASLDGAYQTLQYESIIRLLTANLSADIVEATALEAVSRVLAGIMDLNPDFGRVQGCGIVTYATEEAAQNAIATLNDTELGGRKIFVREDREAQPVSAVKPKRGFRVYVGNLSWNVKWQELKDHMKKVGTVVHADVLEESNGRSKGCGLVEYATQEEAAKAIAELNNTELEGRLIFVREDREPEGGSISKFARRAAAPRGNGEGRQLYVGNVSVSYDDVFLCGVGTIS
ncbi:unnamed protein product [Phytophthora lilii]|uniref:Unnamed protein product n=1 Tax=Phytophthora lilii TaxID=2077276 RepID=A0A9W6TFM4_9STRA|nr:unnamed protein product [Phytophthora lilii]